MTDESIKLVLADDQALVRGALVALLSLEPDIEVVGQCSRGDEVVLTVEKTRPDVLLLDIEMPGMDGIEVADRLAGADVKILIVTTGWLDSSSRTPRPPNWPRQCAGFIREAASSTRPWPQSPCWRGTTR